MFLIKIMDMLLRIISQKVGYPIFFTNSKQDISKMITEIITQNTGDDFIDFELKGISDIALQRKYK
jgi:hypothetical protein